MPPERIDVSYFSSDIREFIVLLHQRAVRYVGIEHLIRNKEAAGRPKDLDDLTYLKSRH